MDVIREELRDTEDVISTDSDNLVAHGFSERSSSNVETSSKHRAGYHCRRDLQQGEGTRRPFGGGSSLEGHISAPFRGASIDFSFMDQIIQMHDENMDVVVQPGLCWTDLNHELEKRNRKLWSPMDPAPSPNKIANSYKFWTHAAKLIFVSCSSFKAVNLMDIYIYISAHTYWFNHSSW